MLATEHYQEQYKTEHRKSSVTTAKDSEVSHYF